MRSLFSEIVRNQLINISYHFPFFKRLLFRLRLRKLVIHWKVSCYLSFEQMLDFCIYGKVIGKNYAKD